MVPAHRRKPPVPFGALVAALIAVAVAVAVMSRDEDHGPTGAAAASRSPSVAASSASPSPAERTSSAPPEVRRELVIHATGDVNLDPGYISTYDAQGYDYAWSGLDGLFLTDDLTIVNVECPVSDLGAQLDKQFSFHGDPDALPEMKDAGVEVGSLANNHAYDRGPDALVDSVRNLRQAEIAPVGAGRDSAEALSPAVFDMKGWRIAVLGFDEVIDPEYQVAGPHKPGTAAGHDFSLMVKAVRETAKDADLVIVMIHWGVELDTQPREYQVTEGHRLIDAGADMIFGGHSHRLQPLSVYRGRPIFWSLGNFVWPNFSAAGSRTGVAHVTVTPRGRFVAKLLPAIIVAPGHPELQ
ncbi:MAG TPA: CapA family protein [Actinomycetota bacterium]|nr:CapA family protein [Actinomycetota bacterium]